jgi:hypothetical protein
MAKRPPTPLPDLNDDELRQRLQPLADRVLPVAPTASPAKATKPKRQGMEFALPEAVALEIKTRAARRNISATTLLLEILRDAGYPVVPADFVDLRKVPRKVG